MLTQALLPSLPSAPRVAEPGPASAMCHVAESVCQGEGCWVHLLCRA